MIENTFIYEGCPETSRTFKIARQRGGGAMSGKWRILAATFLSHLTPSCLVISLYLPVCGFNASAQKDFFLSVSGVNPGQRLFTESSGNCASYDTRNFFSIK
jgi:hypothetical protein